MMQKDAKKVKNCNGEVFIVSGWMKLMRYFPPNLGELEIAKQRK